VIIGKQKGKKVFFIFKHQPSKYIPLTILSHTIFFSTLVLSQNKSIEIANQSQCF